MTIKTDKIVGRRAIQYIEVVISRETIYMLQRFNWVCQACKGANPNRLTMVRSVLLHFLTKTVEWNIDDSLCYTYV